MPRTIATGTSRNEPPTMRATPARAWSVNRSLPGDWRDRNAGEDRVERRFRCCAAEALVEIDDQPVGEDRADDGFHVVGHHERAAVERRRGLGDPVERDGCSRAGPEAEVRLTACRPDDRNEVRLDLLRDVDPPDVVAQREEAGGLADGLDAVEG